MANAEHKDEWITAAEAVRLLKPIFESGYSAKMTICSRAHAGLIRARAEHFMIDDQSADWVEVPKQFWWAEGHHALKQNWTTGDFETWIAKTKRFRAFGVSFLRADIEKLMPTASKNQSPKEPRDTVSREVGVGPNEWDVFISHASEDKDDLVRPLAESLHGEGLLVWFDEFTLTVGDSLRRSIDLGLARSRFGIVVISPNFLQKDWPKRELDGLVAREINGVKVILPVWHNIDADQIRIHSPMLADRLGAPTSKGIDYVKSELLKAIRKNDPEASPVAAGLPGPSNRGSLARLDGQRRRQLLDDISALRETMVQYRIEMEADHSAQRFNKEAWQQKYRELEDQIATKIEQLSSKAEASTYRNRGNIPRAERSGRPGHFINPVLIDVCIYDLDYLKTFIHDYSRKVQG